MDEVTIAGYGLPVLLVVAMGYIYKFSPAIPDRWKSLITMGVGIGLGLCAMVYHGGPYTGKAIIEFVLLGFMSGAAAIGLYEGKRAISSNPRE